MGWYDGIFYKRVISPFLGEIREIINEMIEDDATIVDVGCGTGDLAMQLGKRSKLVVGIERSREMLSVAKDAREKEHLTNVEFYHGDVNVYVKGTDERFDYAIFSFCLHEMSPSQRIPVLKSVSGIAESVIIADFDRPRLENLWGIQSTIAESLSNLAHFSNYLNYTFTGGISTVLRDANLQEIEQKNDSSKKFIIIRAKLKKNEV